MPFLRPPVQRSKTRIYLIYNVVLCFKLRSVPPIQQEPWVRSFIQLGEVEKVNIWSKLHFIHSWTNNQNVVNDARASRNPKSADIFFSCYSILLFRGFWSSIQKYDAIYSGQFVSIGDGFRGFFLKGLWVNDPIGWAYFSTRLVQPIYLVNTTSPTLGVIEWYLMFEPFGHIRKTPCRLVVDHHRWKLSQLILERSPDDLSTMRKEWQDQYFSGRWTCPRKTNSVRISSSHFSTLQQIPNLKSHWWKNQTPKNPSITQAVRNLCQDVAIDYFLKKKRNFVCLAMQVPRLGNQPKNQAGFFRGAVVKVRISKKKTFRQNPENSTNSLLSSSGGIKVISGSQPQAVDWYGMQMTVAVNPVPYLPVRSINLLDFQQTSRKFDLHFGQWDWDIYISSSVRPFQSIQHIEHFPARPGSSKTFFSNWDYHVNSYWCTSGFGSVIVHKTIVGWWCWKGYTLVG